MRIHLLVLDEVFDLGLAALTDTLTTANELAATLADAPPPIELTLVGVRRGVRTAHGLIVPIRPAADVRPPDIALVPALGAKMPETLAARLARADVRDAVATLQRWSAAGATTGAACTARSCSRKARSWTANVPRPRGGSRPCFASAIPASRSTSRECW